MSDFKIMFPSMDGDVIEAVLRANGGAVDATIDNLLTMSADAEAAEHVRFFRKHGFSHLLSIGKGFNGEVRGNLHPTLP